LLPIAPAGLLLPNTRILQRKGACSATPGPTGDCKADQKKRFGRRRNDLSFFGPNRSELPSIVHAVVDSPGYPLDHETRAFMEPRFGHDFSRVRLHTDAKAAESAQAVNAFAYTVGANIVIRSEKYAPSTAKGRLLLAHELAHVVQQAVGYAGTGVEMRADLAAHKVTAGQRAPSGLVGTSPVGLCKQSDDTEDDSAVDQELINLIRSQFRSRQRRAMSPPIPSSSPLSPEWRPQGTISMVRPEEKSRTPNFDWSVNYRKGPIPADPLSAGINPGNPDAEREQFRNEALQAFGMTGKIRTPSEVMIEVLKKGTIKTAKQLLADYFPELKDLPMRLKRILIGKKKERMNPLE
jgi:hypothetical protein